MTTRANDALIDSYKGFRTKISNRKDDGDNEKTIKI